MLSLDTKQSINILPYFVCLFECNEYPLEIVKILFRAMSLFSLVANL